MSSKADPFYSLCLSYLQRVQSQYRFNQSASKAIAKLIRPAEQQAARCRSQKQID